jgi:signal transduction histidine kinase
VVLALSGVLLLGVVATATVVLCNSLARSNALAEAERSAGRLAQLIVAPFLREAAGGRAESLEELDRVLANRLGDGSIDRVVVWAADGEVVYSTDEGLRGRQLPVTDDLRTALDGEVVSQVDDRPENDPESGTSVEVYVPVEVAGEPIVVETYFAGGGVERAAARLRRQIVPLAVGALVVLQAVQLPVAVSLARRVRRQEAERRDLLARSLSASDRERRAIAADVHDGPVQDLAGVSYALSALRHVVPDERHPTVDRLVTTVRHAVASLRRLMADIYPIDLSQAGLAAALDDLAQQVREDGATATVETDDVPPLQPETSAVLYRTAKEALTNVRKHAGAQTVLIRLTGDRLDGRPAVRLTVTDDGVGFTLDTTPSSGNGPGHLGVRLLTDRVVDAGGVVSIAPVPEGGTVVTAVLPLDSAG